MDWNEILERVCTLVKEDGRRILAMKRPEVFEKEGHANFVTSADLASQSFLLEGLAPLVPGAHFFAEEQEEHVLAPGYNWLIDPIDGTTNFMRGLRCSSISVGLVNDGKAVLGVVYQFYSDELFCAVRDKGAFLNGKPIHAADTPLDKALIEVGTSPYLTAFHAATAAIMHKALSCCGDLRRSGSAAVDLCAIAAGRADAFVEARLSPWDYAASSVILEEAGAQITSCAPFTLDFQNSTPVIAGAGEAFDFVCRTAAAVLSGEGGA